MTYPFPAGLTLLSAKMSVAAILTTDQKVFLPVKEIDHVGRTWLQFRLMERFIIRGDTVTIEFVDDIPDKEYPAQQEVEVLLGAFDG